MLREQDGFLSGQEISARFGVSRTSVWKAIRKLEEEGYVIEAVTNRGYRLVSEPDLLTEARIRRYLHTEWAGKEILIFDSIDSTNNELNRRAGEGAPHGLFAAADEQTAGKGRRGRYWASDKGDSISMSLLLRPDINPGRASMLTLVMGMAVRSALSGIGVSGAGIKWPNDIVVNGKKICGILTEMNAQIDYINHIVIGVGINVHNAEFPEEVRSTATSVFLETGEHANRAQIAAECLNAFEGYYARYLKYQDLRDLTDEYNSVLINRGRQVRVLDGKQVFTGTAEGINAGGELIVETPDGQRKLVGSGEVSVRGVYGYV